MKRENVFALVVVGGPQTEVLYHWYKHAVDNFKILPQNVLVGFHENEMYPAKNERWKQIFNDLNITPVKTIKSMGWTAEVQTSLFSSLHDVANAVEGWTVRADCDELLEFYCGNNDILELIDDLESRNESFIRGITCDRIAADGSLLEITREKTLFEQFPIALYEYARLKTLARIVRGLSNPNVRADRPEGSGIAIHKNRIPITKSVHNFDNPNDSRLKECHKYAILHHFKYDKEFFDKHKEFGKEVGKMYGHPDISAIIEKFYNFDANKLDIKKISEAFDKQTTPKRFEFDTKFPTLQSTPKWV